MGQLGRRDAPRLLSKINGKTHAMADGHRDPLPQTPKAPRIHIPEEVKVYLDRLSASPTSSSGGSLPSSADIPTTLFKTGLEKETKAKPLRDIGNGRRGNRSTTTAQKPARKGTESPDSKKLGDWGVERKPKKKPMKKILVMKSIPNSAKISNIHAPLQSKATNNEKISSKFNTPTKKKSTNGNISMPPEVRMNRSPGSVSKGGLRIPGLLPTPRTTQTSPSPKNKRQSSDEYDLDHAAKKQKRDSGYFSVLSSQLSSPPEDLEEKETECKTCFQEVDRALVEKYPWPSSCPTMHDKRIFCNWHKTEEAKQEWKCKGYPTINWVELKKKLDDYNSQLQQVIDEPETSHYRKELKDKTKTGKGQSLARMEQNGLEGVDLELGFYGYRGLTMMTNNITYNFHDVLRNKVVGDYVMSKKAGGVGAYVRLVLAPELATMLIRDEMKVSIERARGILEESRAVGEVLNSKDIEDEMGPEKRRSTGRRYVDENDESDGE